MCKTTLMAAMVGLIVATTWTAATAGTPVTLKASDIADPNGDGPDGKGNTDDDTWGFWFQHDTRNGYSRLGVYHKRPAAVPDGQNVEGWVYNDTPSGNRHGRTTPAADWSPDFEGVWGNTSNGEVHMHPYTHHGNHASVAITYKVPADGLYVITGGITDVQVTKSAPHDGVIWAVEVVNDGKAASGRLLGKGDPIGDTNPKDSTKFTIRKTLLRKGELVRFVIDPVKWWGRDMTRIDSFAVERVDVREPATQPAKPADPNKPGATTKPAKSAWEGVRLPAAGGVIVAMGLMIAGCGGVRRNHKSQISDYKQVPGTKQQ